MFRFFCSPILLARQLPKIYEATGFINPARVRIALAEKKALDQVEFVEVDVMKGEHRQAAFRAKNPSASVPVLELECGTAIAKCSAITEYIDHNFPVENN